MMQTSFYKGSEFACRADAETALKHKRKDRRQNISGKDEQKTYAVKYE